MATFRVYPWFILVFIISERTQPLSCELLAKTSLLRNSTQDISNSNSEIERVPLAHNPLFKERCVKQEYCKFVCFFGKANNLESDIKLTEERSTYQCSTIVELRIYNYQFPNNVLQRDFLCSYTKRVESLYIASSDITDYQSGVFSDGIFKKLYFEDLKFTEMREDFFEGISADFHALTIIQQKEKLTSVHSSFLNYVKYQIKYLSLQLGIESLHNVTAMQNILNNLAYVDFSYNNFGNYLVEYSFEKLTIVEHLDLSHSNISYLGEYLFAEMTLSLKYLDLSYNHLLTISRMIFGWRQISQDLRICANDNDWVCSCELLTEMKAIFTHQPPSSHMFCNSPEEYFNWSVFDSRFCVDVSPTTWHPRPVTDPTLKGTTSDTNENGSTSAAYPNATCIVNLECHSSNEYLKEGRLNIQGPTTHFDVYTHPNLSVKIAAQSDGLLEPHGLIWFSRVTIEYNKMEANYKEYGLGCWGNISHTTTVQNLVPNSAYTFCVVPRDQLTVSPLSCKSIHVSSKVGITAWPAQDMRPSGISLVIIGIVIFTFIGMLMTFLLLKQKPTLLRGSTRVVRNKRSLRQIIVFPNDKMCEDFTKKEKSLSKRNSSLIAKSKRRCSMDSASSYQSYINVNMYEVMPDFRKFNVDSLIATNAKYFNGTKYSQHQPSRIHPNVSNSVSYAELPFSVKRDSSDPLPDLPQDQEPLSLPLSEK